MSDFLSQLPTQDGAPFLGKVRLLREIGRGGMGVVYGGWHTVLDIPVAVKVLLGSGKLEAEQLTRFQREARICAAMDEPNLLRVFDLGFAGPSPYLIMEYVAGRSLDRVVASAGPLQEPEVLTLLRDLALVLLSLHRAGVVHRDIKPSNLLLRSADGRIKLADLGIAKVAGNTDALNTSTALGTPAYMSPEQFQALDRVGPAADFFSLGACACFLLTGEQPFGGDTVFQVMQRICNEPLDEQPLLRAGVSPGTLDLLRHLTARRIEDRLVGGERLLERLPATSFPFRPQTLQAARPDHTLQRDGADVLRTSTVHVSGEATSVGPDLQSTQTYGQRRRRALLICECLQNDFIAPIPAGKSVPNKLHLGREEAQRLVGRDPASGPLVQAVSACAEAEHMRIIHVRDWHDPHDPRQQAELAFFGEHCVMGSWGARFIDVLESYSRNRSRSAVVDATGINDFEDTPLLETIEALIEDEDRATLPVGVIGVWTNVKIHYLLYDLKTRARLQNLATCSRLVAAPDRVAHRNTLQHLETILNVKVFHEVEAFLEFLGVAGA